MSVKLFRCKPNPAGKDTATPGVATPAQLAGEWCDVKNTGTTAFDLSHVRLYHVAYTAQGAKWESVVEEDVRLVAVLAPGQVLRVHAGKVRHLSVIRQEDLSGADVHAFTGRDWFVWNNWRDDTPAIWQPSVQQFVDRAAYTTPVPEGAVLVRQGDLLVTNFLSSLGLTSRTQPGGQR